MASKLVNAYEQRFAKLFDAKRAFAFWKGRVALYVILKTLGVGEGDEVILPGYTCVMAVNPVKYLGAKPVYVDIEPDTFNMNIELLEDRITDKTKIVVAQHTYGYPCDMDGMLEIASRKGVTVVEDCCLALGSTYKAKTVGTFGKAAYFSSQWNKPYTTGLGGMVITDDLDLAEKIKQLCNNEQCFPSLKEVSMIFAQLIVYRTLIYPRTTAFAQNVFRYLTKKGIVVGSSSRSEYEPVMANDFFKGMSYMQAWSGLHQLKKLNSNMVHRKKMAQLYDKLLSEKGWKPKEYDRKMIDPVMVRYPVRVTEKNKILTEAAKVGVELGSWFECPLHPAETPLEAYDYHCGMCPEAEKACREVINLPLHPRVSEKTVKTIVEFVTNFIQAN